MFSPSCGSVSYKLRTLCNPDPVRSLHMSSLGVFWPNSTPLVRKIFFATVAAALAFFNRRRLLWPGSGPDKSFPNTPLPPSTMGCPFVGRNLLGVSELRGPMYVILDAFKKVGRQKLVTMYSFFIPIIAVSGQNTIKKVLEREFDPEGANTVSEKALLLLLIVIVFNAVFSIC